MNPVPPTTADLSTRTLASGAGVTFVGTVVERIFGVALFLLLPFLLPLRSLGVFYEVVALVTLAGTVATVGVDVGVVRFTALSLERGRPEDVGRYLRIAVRSVSALSVLISAALWLAAPALGRVFDAPPFAPALRLAVPAIPLLSGAAVMVAPSKGMKRMWPAAFALQIVHPGLALVGSLVLLLAGQGLNGAILGFTIAAAGAWVAAAQLSGTRGTRRAGDPTAGTSSGAAARALFAFSAPVAGTILTGTLLLWLDTLLLGAFRGPSDVATYGIVVRLFSITSGVLYTVVQIFGPFVTQLVARRDLVRLQEVLRTATRWTFLLAAPILVFLVIEGSSVVSLFARPATPVDAAITILGLAFLVDAVTGPVGHVLTMSGRSALNLVNNSIALVSNLGLNLLLIPRFGILGAALSWSVVIAGVNLARVLQTRALFGVGPFSAALFKPSAAVTAAAAAGLVGGRMTAGLGRPWPTVVAGLAFGAAYAVVLPALRLHPEDRTLLRRVAIRPGRGRVSAPETAEARG